MIFLNVGHSWTLAGEFDELQGIVLLPTGNPLPRITRSALPDMRRLLLDPQLYLAELDVVKCSKVCARLASFPWFQVEDLPEFDSATMKRREWDKEMREQIASVWPAQAPTGEEEIFDATYSAVEIQLNAGCTHIILPAPLIREREDEAQIQADWLDAGLEAAEELDCAQPLLASVAVADTVLTDRAFVTGGFLDTVADQISARDGLAGVYIVVAQAPRVHPLSTPLPVLHAYLHLVTAFSRQNYDLVLVNFADLFGFACIAAGATGIATGATQNLRRLSLTGFNDKGFGKQLPHLYSHRLIGEFLSETDLDRVVEKRLLRRLRDVTPFSAPLIEELAEGGSAANLLPWAESRSNVRAAHRHFITRVVREERRLARQTPSERDDSVRDWLEGAAANATYVKRRLGKPPIKGKTAPAQKWLDLYDDVS